MDDNPLELRSAEPHRLIEEHRTLAGQLAELRSQTANLLETIHQLRAAVQEERARNAELQQRAEKFEQRLRSLQSRTPSQPQSADAGDDSAAESVMEFPVSDDDEEDGLATVMESAFLDEDDPPIFADSELIRELIANLGADDQADRDAAYQSLADLGPSAAPQLTQTLATADARRRRQIVRLLALGGVQPDLTLEPLQSCLFDEDHRVREDAVRAFRGMGPEAIRAVAPLIVASQDDHEPVRKLATETLKQIPGDHLSQLRRDIGSGRRSRVLLGLKAASYLGPHAADLAPDLARCLDSDDAEIVSGAMSALAELNQPPPTS